MKNNPTADFPTRQKAREAALAINNATDSYCCSYKCIPHKITGCKKNWTIEADGLSLKKFLEILKRHIYHVYHDNCKGVNHDPSKQ